MTADLSAMTEAARAVPGVSAVRLQPDERGAVEAVHLELEPGADRVAVSLAISALLAEAPGSGIDVQDVQVAPVTSISPEPEMPTQRGQRPVLLRSGLTTSGLEVGVTVVLVHGDRTATGEAVGTPTTRGVRRSAARAALQAVEVLLGDAARFELELVELVDAGGDRSVLVCLSLVTPRSVERLTGAAAVRDEEHLAVIRATLDAVNRRLETLLP